MFHQICKQRKQSTIFQELWHQIIWTQMVICRHICNTRVKYIL